MTRWPRAIVLLGLLLYLAVSLNRLSVFRPVGEDEPWIAAAPYKLATQGVLGSDLFAGYYGMERHHYEQMPIFPLLQAAVVRLFGAGVTQMLPIDLAYPGYYDEPMSLDEALARVNPDVILVDRHIDDLMREGADPRSPNHRLYVGFEAFKAQRGATLTCVIKDRTYGSMQVIVLPPRR